MTIRGLLERNAAATPDRVAMTWCENKVWKRRTWREWLARVRDLAEGYGTRFALKPREENVALILGNSPAWLECYLAQSGAGVAVVPMDPKFKPAEMEYILNDAEVRVITTDTAHLRMMMNLAPKLKHLRGIVVTDGIIFEGQRIGDVEVVDIEQMRISGGGAWYDAHVAAEEDVASIIYTSGTTGKPKGAMLTQRNFVSDIEGGVATFDANLVPEDAFLCVLPLFHAFSFVANFMCPLYVGCEIQFVESLRTVARDMKILKPTALCAVPLLVEKLYDKIQEGLKGSKLARFLMAIGLRGPVMHMVLGKLGGRLRFMVTGGAPCPRHVIECFRRLHVNLVEGYGLTECAPVVSVTNASCRKIGTIGRPCAGVEVKVDSPDGSGVGELLVRGPNVMKGYFHNEAATREALKDGWLATGDLVSVDAEGYMTIRGRKKALIVNREGKNIYPEEVEGIVSKDPAVQDVIVIGYTQDGEPGERVGAIVYPNEEWLAAQNGGAKPDWLKVEKTVVKRVQEKSAELADYKHIRKIVVSHEPLERTSVGKIRRVAYKGKLDE